MRTLGKVVAVVVAIAVLAFAVASLLGYQRQVVRYFTRWKGSPTSTEAFVPYDPADPPDVHLGVAGDVGDSGSRIESTGRAMAEVEDQQEYDALLLLGDNSYPAGDPAILQDVVFGPFEDVLDDDTELLAILGNHDVKEGNGPRQVEALGMDGPWWTRTIDDVFLLGLDSNVADDPEQLAFAEEALAGTDATWRIVLIHHPPYSAGYQGSSMEVRELWTPIFERYGVQLVLSGHDHDYQRSEVIDGVTYVVSGAAAGTRRTSSEDFTAESFSWHHFLDIGIWPDRLVLRAVNQDVRVADEVTIRP